MDYESTKSAEEPGFLPFVGNTRQCGIQRGTLVVLDPIRAPFVVCFLLTLVTHTAAADLSPKVAATKYVPGVIWREHSVITGDFSCRGRKERAILGTSASEIVVAVFLDGTNQRPQLLRYSAEGRNPSRTVLKSEDLDYDPKEEIGTVLPGFQRSKSCQGLNLSDGQTDSTHIYWNHDSHQFDNWVR
jgi:hypothetical protein